MVTQSERIKGLETEIKIVIPEIKKDIKSIEENQTKMAVDIGIIKSKIMNGHTDKWLPAGTKDLIIRWGIRSGIAIVAGKSILDSIPK